MQPSVMVEQVMDLPSLIREYTPLFARSVRDLLTPPEYLAIQRVYLVGDGDSFFAAHAAELAFENIGGIACEPMSAQRYLDYGAEWMFSAAPGATAVVAISASGRTPRVVQAIERARQFGAFTIALTGTPDSPVTRVADHSLVVQIPDLGPAPGIRSYHANLMGLLLIAIHIGEIKSRYPQGEAEALRGEMSSLAGVIEATIRATEGPARRAAEALRDGEIQVWAGSGPSYGTALFSAAKVVEAAGVFSTGQDLEEWWHVERFAYPADVPTFVIAPPGRSHWRAVNLVGTAKALGRRVIVIAQEGDEAMAARADWVFPVVGEVREEFSPLVYHVAADLFASFLAETLGRKLLQTDNPQFLQSVASYYAVGEDEGRRTEDDRRPTTANG